MSISRRTPVRSRQPEPRRGVGFVEEELNSLFRLSPYLALRQVSCVLLNGTATLTGTVPSFYLKQLAQVLVSSQHGVNDVRNHLTVG